MVVRRFGSFGTYAAYRLAVLRTWRLCAVDESILLMQGLFPLDRKTITIRWIDVGSMTCNTGLWAWLSRSHLVTVSHRFNLAGVIAFDDVWEGQVAAAILTRIQTGRLRGLALAVAADVPMVAERAVEHYSAFPSVGS